MINYPRHKLISSTESQGNDINPLFLRRRDSVPCRFSLALCAQRTPHVYNSMNSSDNARLSLWHRFPDNKVHGANMGPTWGRQVPGGPMLAPWTLLFGLLVLETVIKHSTTCSFFCQHFHRFMDVNSSGTRFLYQGLEWGILNQLPPFPVRSVVFPIFSPLLKHWVPIE